ncbi:MAG: indole-3-glycerol phosphate synthase TrpC [Verrucomicrobiota bacterium]
MDKLAEIMAWKRQEIAPRVRPVTERELSHLSTMQRSSRPFRDALKREDEGLAVIAEIKRKSPSAGEIKQLPDAAEQARLYLNAEADAFSVLTDEKYFGGTLQDLWGVVDFIEDHQRPTPCLRKDFMVDPIQIIEAAEAGARCILIIVRALEDDEIKKLYDCANLAGLDSLFEVHTESELERALTFGPKIVGVNNRDLSRFVTDLAISETIIPQIPDEIIAVSESGIFDTDDAERASACGANAILVGEALMKAEDPEALVKAFHEA